MVNLVSFCNFVVDVIKNIKFYSLFVKSFTIHRTIKVPGTFKFFTISQSCYKTDRHDITEILLKVALNTIKQTNQHNQDYALNVINCQNLSSYG